MSFEDVHDADQPRSGRTLAALMRLRRGESDVYTQFRQRLGRSILLGLELLVAGDIIRRLPPNPPSPPSPYWPGSS